MTQTRQSRTYTVEQLRRARELAAQLARQERPASKRNPLRKASMWQAQITRERELERPTDLRNHEFTSDLGTFVDWSTPCTTCGMLLGHVAHNRAAEPMSTSPLDPPTEWSDSDVEAAMHGDADERGDNRREAQNPSWNVIPPKYIETLVPVAPSVVQRVRILLEQGESDREVDFIRPRPQPSEKARAAKCARCGYRGLTPRSQTCCQCGHDRNQRVKPIPSKVADRIGGFEFVRFTRTER